MNTSKKITRTAGIIFLTGTVAGILSIATAIDEPDFLISISANENRILIAAFFQFIMAVSYIGFAITLHPLLRMYNISLSLAFVSSRIIAGLFNIIGVILLILLMQLSRDFLILENPESLFFLTVGNLLRSGRDYINHIAIIWTLSLGSLSLYYILYKTRFVHRWLSIWGLSGALLSFIAASLFMFQSIDLLTSVYMAIPLALQEIIFALWLIFKGFDSELCHNISTDEVTSID